MNELNRLFSQRRKTIFISDWPFENRPINGDEQCFPFSHKIFSAGAEARGLSLMYFGTLTRRGVVYFRAHHSNAFSYDATYVYDAKK